MFQAVQFYFMMTSYIYIISMFLSKSVLHLGCVIVELLDLFRTLFVRCSNSKSQVLARVYLTVV